MPSLASRAGAAALTAVLAFTTAATAVPTEAEASGSDRNNAALSFFAGAATGFVLRQTAPARRPRQREQVIIVVPPYEANVYYYDADINYRSPRTLRCRRVTNRNGEPLYEWDGQPAFNCR